MKILITGAKGQLGQSINKLAMQYQDFEFTFTDYSELDITNQGQLDQLFEDAGYDYCINCAAYTAVDKAEQEVEQAYRINADAVKLLAKTCSRNQVVLIHISTDFVFDGKKQTPYTEEDIPNPISIYGKSKLQGDKRIQECLKEHFIIRTSWVYSEYGGNFVKTMLRLGKEKDELRVISDQIGAPTYATDLAGFILNLISTGSKEYGIINYSNQGKISWFDFASAIMEEGGLNTQVTPIPSSEYETAAKRPHYSVLSLDKALHQYNAELFGWRDSLRKCIHILIN